jgi:hypothetical protein
MDPRRDGRHRFLIATGVTNGLREIGEKVAASVEAMTDLLVGVFGYEPAAGLGLDPAADRFREALREFCLARSPRTWSCFITPGTRTWPVICIGCGWATPATAARRRWLPVSWPS